jgi:hypothetical protein
MKRFLSVLVLFLILLTVNASAQWRWSSRGVWLQESIGSLDASNAAVSVGTLTIGGTSQGGDIQNTLFQSPTISGTLTLNAVTATGTMTGGVLAGPTITAPTITTPTIGTIINTGTITLPTSTDTIVCRATTDTLTNKTLTAPVVGGGLTASGSAANTFAGSTGTFVTSTGLNTLSGLVAIKTIATPVAAAGSTVADAGQLGAANVVLISSDGATKGVKLGTGVSGQVIYVINTSATAAELYAASGGTVNGLSADASIVVPASKGVICICTAADTWVVFDLTARATASS